MSVCPQKKNTSLFFPGEKTIIFPIVSENELRKLKGPKEPNTVTSLSFPSFFIKKDAYSPAGLEGGRG